MQRDGRNSTPIAAAYTRGIATEPPEEEGDDTKGGLWSLKQQFGVRLVNEHGVNGALYSRFEGEAWRDKPKHSAEIRMIFGGVLVINRQEDDGAWRCVIVGKELDEVHNHLSEGRRISVIPMTTPNQNGMFIHSIRFEKLSP